MTQLPERWIIALAAAAFVVGAALPAHAQGTWDEVPLLGSSLLSTPALSSALTPAAPAAQAEGGFPNFTLGVRLGGFFLTALFAVVSAVSLVLGVVGSAWEVDNFDVNEYLAELKESRTSGS